MTIGFRSLAVAAVLPWLVLAPVSAIAADACDQPRDDFDGLYCLNKVYQDADAQLNQWFGRVRAKLDAQGKTALKESQLTWISDRNAQCSKREGNAFFVNLKCATRMTLERSQVLQSRYQACLSGPCSWSG